MDKTALVAGILKDVASIAHSLDQGGLQAFEVTVSQLRDALKPVLPSKVDGSPFTDEELHAIAVDARAGFDAVLDREQSETKPPIPNDVA